MGQRECLPVSLRTTAPPEADAVLKAETRAQVARIQDLIDGLDDHGRELAALALLLLGRQHLQYLLRGIQCVRVEFRYQFHDTLRAAVDREFARLEMPGEGEDVLDTDVQHTR